MKNPIKPDSYIVISKKSKQGWWVSTTDKTLWTTGNDATGSSFPDQGKMKNYPKYANVYETSMRISILQNDHAYSSTPNLVINGLQPNHSYSIQWVGKGFYNSSPPRMAVMQWGSMKDTLNTSNFIIERPHEMTGESDSNGQIKLGWYKTSFVGGSVRLQYLVI